MEVLCVVACSKGLDNLVIVKVAVFFVFDVHLNFYYYFVSITVFKYAYWALPHNSEQRKKQKDNHKHQLIPRSSRIMIKGEDN